VIYSLQTGSTAAMAGATHRDHITQDRLRLDVDSQYRSVRGTYQPAGTLYNNVSLNAHWTGHCRLDR